MCLCKINKVYNPPLVQEREGWKWFELTRTVLQSPFTEEEIPRGTWLQTKTEKTLTHWKNQKVSYRAGFHYFPSRASALKYGAPSPFCVLLPVKVRGIRLHGRQDECDHNYSATVPCSVADEMFVPKEATNGN